MSQLAGPVWKGSRVAILIVLALADRAGSLAAGEAPKAPPGKLGEEVFRFGREGIGPSQMTRVEHVAVDPAGFVYLGDFDLGRLQRFSPEGRLAAVAYVQQDRIDSLAYERSGVLFVVTLYHLYRYDAKTLKLLGEIERPAGGEYLAIAARPGGGVIAVLESRDISDDIAFLDKEGKLERVLHGAIEKAAGYTVQRPFVTMDGKGFFYVVDNGNHAIFKFDPEGRYISRFGYTGHPAGDSNTDFAGLVADGRGQLWVSGWSTLNVVTADGRPRQSYEMSSYGLAVDDKDELYVTDRTQVRRYAAALPPEKDPPAPAKAAADVGKEPPVPKTPRQDAPLQRFQPKGSPGKAALATVDPEGNLYTAEAGSGHVLRFTPEGKGGDAFSTGEPPCQVTGLAADRGGIVYVACGGRLLRYEGASRKLLGEVRHPDGAGFFHVAARPDAGVLASWRNAQRDDFVLVAGDGTVETIHRNAVTGASGQPAGDVLVAMDGRRTIYAAVNPLHAVCVFKFTGEYVNRFGSEGEDPDQFSGPLTGLAVDGQGQVFVSDAKGVSILLSEDGRFLRRLNVKDTGLAVDDDGALFAAAGAEVVKYQVAPPPKKE